MSKINVAVVILNWNGAEMLRKFLPSVLTYSQGEGVKVYVADNASTDDSCAVVEKEFPEACLMRLDQNYGYAGGYNKALKQIDAEYVVLLNNDVEVGKGWLEPMVKYMDEHPQVAACQPKILSWRVKTNFEYAGAAGGFIDRYGYPFCRGRVLDELEEDRGQYDYNIPIFWATGAALFVRRNVYWEVGGLDERFFAHMEEIDFCWRLRSRGYRIVCLPLCEVYHVGGATLKTSDPKKTYLNFRNNLLMLYKNLPAKELKRVMRVRLILDYLAAGFFALRGKVGEARAVLKARCDYVAMRPQFETDRKENLQKSVNTDIGERYRFSLLWRVQGRRKRTYEELIG